MINSKNILIIKIISEKIQNNTEIISTFKMGHLKLFSTNLTITLEKYILHSKNKKEVAIIDYISFDFKIRCHRI